MNLFQSPKCSVHVSIDQYFHHDILVNIDIPVPKSIRYTGLEISDKNKNSGLCCCFYSYCLAVFFQTFLSVASFWNVF